LGVRESLIHNDASSRKKIRERERTGRVTSWSWLGKKKVGEDFQLSVLCYFFKNVNGGRKDIKAL